MDTWFISKNVNREAKKRFRNSSKPFWNEELMDLWQRVVESETNIWLVPKIRDFGKFTRHNNYADDNSLAKIDSDINVIKAEHEVSSGVAIQLFKETFM